MAARTLIGGAQVARILLKQSARCARPHLTQTHFTPISTVLRTPLHTSAPKFNEHVINIQDDEDFQKRVLGSETPVVVDFHATWCGPCKILGPRLESLVSAQKGQVLMAKVDIDDHSDLAIDHGVAAVPTVVAIKGGKVVDKFVGVKDDTELQSFVSKLTGK